MCPISCRFKRLRNPAEQTGSAAAYHYAPQRARPLWGAECTFELSRIDQVAFRSLVDAMDGQRNYRMIWDFANPWPSLSSSVQQTSGSFSWSFDGSSVSWDYDITNPLLNGAAALIGAEPDALAVDFTADDWLDDTGHYGAAIIKEDVPLTLGSNSWAHNQIDYTAFEDSVAVNGSYPVGTTTFSTLYWPASTTVLLRGDLIQLGEYLYVVMKNVWSDASGVADIEISSGLVESITGATDLRLTQPAARMRLDQVEWSTDKGWNDPYAMATLKFIEVA